MMDNQSRNASNATGNQGLLRDRALELYFWTIVSFCLCIIGSLNNILVLLVTRPRAGGNKVGLRLLIFHFIAINLLMCIINHPIRTMMVVANQHGHRAPDGICPFIHLFYNTGWFALSWADAGLALNRLITLYCPHRYRTWSFTRKSNLTMMIFPWLLAFIVFLPASFGWVGDVKIQQMGQCSQILTSQRFAAFNLATTYLAHIIVACGSLMIVWKTYFYARLSGHAVRPSRDHAYDLRAQKTLARRATMVKMLLLTLLWTVMCNVPYFILLTQFPTVLTNNPMSGLWQQVASTSQYAFTPCILLLSNMEYRNRLMQILYGTTPSTVPPVSHVISWQASRT